MDSLQIKAVKILVKIIQDLIKRTSEISNLVTTQNRNIYFYNYQTETAIFIATKHEKQLRQLHLGFYKCFLYFELLASNTIKNETRKKFKKLLEINLVKYSSKFLAHIKKYLGDTGTPRNVQNFT